MGESFFSNLKKERIKKRICASREVATSGISDYIDGLYSPARRDNHFGGVSPDELEAAHRPRRSGVQLNKALVNRMPHRFLKLL